MMSPLRFFYHHRQFIISKAKVAVHDLWRIGRLGKRIASTLQRIAELQLVVIVVGERHPEPNVTPCLHLAIADHRQLMRHIITVLCRHLAE